MKNDLKFYSVGPLLYCPGNKKTIADSIKNESFGRSFSLALCLEDTINDYFVSEAESSLVTSIRRIYESSKLQDFFVPNIFIRVRNPEQICRLTRSLGDGITVITGFIIPKFSLENVSEYLQQMIRVNEQVEKTLFFMPIYESASMVDLRSRFDILYSLKDMLAPVEKLILNIRVGGNDLCHIFGFRRHSCESIHQIKPIADIFSDIITVYGMDYVISGPVWEYYAGEGWKEGLTREIREDKLCGFIGKTAIHPRQIPVINAGYQVSLSDYKDALSILSWNPSSDHYVSGSQDGKRMNEYKTHTLWAEKTIFLAKAFGVRDETS